jgi:uncharacterized protein (DUF58 family)
MLPSPARIYLPHSPFASGGGGNDPVAFIMPASETRASDVVHGTTRVDLAELIALRASAGKPGMQRAKAPTPLAGGHLVPLRGRGMDYMESRAYQRGDDARNIDWRRTARSGKWHTKVFQVEREHSAVILVDTHATMRFGTRTRFKSVAAARAAAWLAWTCVRGGDRVGAMAFGAVRDAVDPRPGVRGALNVAGALARWDAQASAQGEDLHEPWSGALRRAQRLVPHGGQAWLVSDGWCVDDAAVPALVRLARHVDLRVVIAVDALEGGLAPAGSYVFEMASGKRRVDLASAATRALFRDRLSHGRLELAAACDRAGVAWIEFAAAADPGACLAPFLRRRSRRP